MLTDKQIQQNKLWYFDILSKLNIDLTTISNYLNAVDFFNKPASAQAFKAYPGGLCETSLTFYSELLQLCNAYFPGRYTEADVIKVMFGRDLYRAEMYETYQKNVKTDTGWEAVSAYRIKEVRPTFGELGFSSYMVAKKFMDFTDEQALAIVYSKSMEYVSDIHDVLRSYPLVTLTRMADMVTNYLAA